MIRLTGRRVKPVMKRASVLICGSILFGLTACGGTSAPPRAATTLPVAHDEATRRACQAEAERRFRSIPAVSSGKTSYLHTDDWELFYRECLARRTAGR